MASDVYHNTLSGVVINIMNGIKDGVAVVTGGGSGIGRQSSLRFAEEGAKVVVADVDEDGGHETVEMIKSDGGEGTFARTDVTDSDDVAAMVQTALDEYGGLDFAHNNAGIAEEGGPSRRLRRSGVGPDARHQLEGSLAVSKIGNTGDDRTRWGSHR